MESNYSKSLHYKDIDTQVNRDYGVYDQFENSKILKIPTLKACKKKSDWMWWIALWFIKNWRAPNVFWKSLTFWLPIILMRIHEIFIVPDGRGRNVGVDLSSPFC